MKLLLRRIALRDTYTIGHLYVNGIYFCDTLEDKVRDLDKDGDLDKPDESKVYGETAIPYGTYEVVIDYSSHFKRKMPHLLNVKDFTGIRIHWGDFTRDTAGCILVGKNTVVGQLRKSLAIFAVLFNILNDAIKAGDKVTITIE